MPTLDGMPGWLRRVGRGARLASYIFVAGIAVGDLLYAVPLRHKTDALIDGWSTFMILVALAGFLSVLIHRWRWEWNIAFWLSLMVCLRAIFVWTTPGPPPPISDGSLTTVVAIFLFLRGCDLTRFAINTSAWKIRAIRLRRVRTQ